MDKNIGFRRNIYLSWLDATAAFCAETDDPAEIRARLQPIVGQEVHSAGNRRIAIDILINVWVKSLEIAPHLRDGAVSLFQNATVSSDRLWLHYGLTLLYYPFFRQSVAVIGQLSRLQDAITPTMVKQRLIADRGQLGALEKAVERVVFSLRDWGVLAPSARRYQYVPCRHGLGARGQELEAWLLACVLHAHPAEEIVFADLLRLPELFPFRFTLGVDYLRHQANFVVQRQGIGWDMVRLVDIAAPPAAAEARATPTLQPALV